MTIYQIAESLGTTADDVRDRLTPADMAEWAVYLNSPFSMRSRSTMENGWLVHTVRAMVAKKGSRPKFGDSVFPYDKVYRGFFSQRAEAKVTTEKGKAKTPGEVQMLAQQIRERYEQWQKDYRAGRVTNSHGLYYRERMAK